MLCLRAKTLGASGVLLASLPGASRFYLSLGGERATGWNVAHGLHPFIFREHVLTQITETLDDLLEEDE